MVPARLQTQSTRFELPMPPTSGTTDSLQYALAGRTESAAFQPPRLLAHRHLQSTLTQAPWRRRSVRRGARGLLATSVAEIVDCGDGVRLQGFLSKPGTGARGLVVLLHGWEGSADSNYILSMGSALLAAGFAVFRLNLRDHGDTKALNEGLFHSCRIDEVFNAVRCVRERHAGDRFAIVGQSLGGNFALRIAARAARAGLRLDRVFAACPVLRPASTMHALDKGPWFYRHYFLARWRRSLLEKAAAFPELYRFGDLRRFATLSATTEYFVENYTEFDSLEQYLEGYAVTGPVLESVAVPTRILLAADDPMIPVQDLEAIAQPAAIEVSLESRGGHCGFIDSLTGASWIDREIVADLARTIP
jgi:predicted alpha/beta-fold hydrolase